MDGPIRRQPAIYRRIMHDLKASIAGGLHPVGAMLPSSTRLAADYHTTRSTVTKALLLLIQDGWIEPRQGVGHFVSPVDRRGAASVTAPRTHVTDARVDGADGAGAAFYWTVPGVVVRVHDGDTVLAALDLGWHLLLSVSIRLAHINAPELSTPEGQTAAAFARQLLAPGAAVMVRSERLDKYGRTLATITLPTAYQAADGRTTTDFGTAMLWTGNAVPYEGR